MAEGKKGKKLARFDLVPPKALWLLAEVYGRGAEKYADRNWEKGIEYGDLYAAMQRHAWKWWAGETTDPEDGQHHLASVIWMAAALIEMEETHPELDTRSRALQLDSELLNPEDIEAAKEEVRGLKGLSPDNPFVDGSSRYEDVFGHSPRWEFDDEQKEAKA